MPFEPNIKICGITDPDVAKQTVKAGVKYIGIMCYRESPRYVPENVAIEISKVVRRNGGIPVAVFVNASSERMQAFCKKAKIDHVQLHGNRARQQHCLLSNDLHRIYALHFDKNGKCLGDPDEGMSFLNPKRDYLLLDSEEGGSGVSFNWNKFLFDSEFPYFLAGGLTPSNVNKATTKIKPFALDVSSGVETKPGVKSIDLIQQFIKHSKEK